MRKLSILMLMLMPCMATASVTSPGSTSIVTPGFNTTIIVKASATSAVAGINGELDYDSTKFSAPSVGVLFGAGAFITAGNVVSPGHYRFVIYANPTATMNLSSPIMYFNLLANSNLALNSTSIASYTLMAASDANGVSLTPVTFNNVTLKTKGNAAGEWSLYE